jgi:FKBP-type peptidyl-prolyl cis-trans isomerase
MGWKEVLIMAKKGSEMTLIIPPSLGYGNHELEQIPKNSIIKYDLKVWDVK